MTLGWLAKTLIISGVKVAAAGVCYALKNDSSQPRPQQKPPLTRNYHYTYKVDTKNQDEKDLNSCLGFFEEGMEMLVTSLDRISCGDKRAEANTEGIQLHELADRIDSLAALDRDVFTAEVDKLKSISKESFTWAKSSFKAARDDATRAFKNEALSVSNRLLAAKVRVLSAIFGCLDEPETAAAACKVYLKELNAMPCICKLFSNQFREINNNDKISYDPLLSLVTFINHSVFHFTETLARNVLHVNNWPRLAITDGWNTPFSLHPIRSVGLRAFTEEKEESKSISFSEPIDAVNMAVNSKGAFIVAGFDRSKNTVVYVYNDIGKFQFAVRPSEEELSGIEFQPCAVFTDKNDNIYVYMRAVTKASQWTDEDASLFLFSKEGRLQRVFSVERGFMALKKKTGEIFISNKKGVLVYESNGELLRSFAAPEALQGSACPIAMCDECTIIQTDIHDPNVYVRTNAGTEVRQFQVKKARGWKYIGFNSISGEIIVSYLSKDLTKFQLDAYLKNGQLLGTIDLPSYYSSHPRSVTVTPSGRVAILYENSVHLI